MRFDEHKSTVRLYLTFFLFILMLSHTYLKVWGAVSLLQVSIVALYFFLVFPRHLSVLFWSCMVVAGFSILQYALFGERIRSAEFSERVYTYPVLFCFLLGFLTVVADLFQTRWLSHRAIGLASTAFLVICAIQAGVSFAVERLALLSWFYNNPNEIAVACTAALFYLAFTGARPLTVYGGGACAMFVTFVGGARFSIVYALAIILLYSYMALPKGSDARSRKVRYASYAAAIVAIAAVVATFAMNTIFYVGGFDEFGITPDALWQGWNAQAPAITSLGFRVNNVLAGLATLVQTYGIGIGIGRSAGLTETISGVGGSIHVPPVEILVELGVYASALLLWINLWGSRWTSFLRILPWFILGAAGLMVQSSAYLTSYLAWFFIVGLCSYKLGNGRNSVPAEADGRAM